MATTKIKALLIIFKWDINKKEVLQKVRFRNAEITLASVHLLKNYCAIRKCDSYHFFCVNLNLLLSK